MNDSQWSEIEAMVRYMIETPSAAERMMPHLRKAVERMPKKWEPHQVEGFLFGFSAAALGGVAVMALCAMTPEPGLWAIAWRWLQ